ncbi:MAG: hypothetical protein Q9209_007493 [Squamulea sp. 1 TL-2023]
MSRGGGTTLYVTGFGHGTRARDLAYEFERSKKCFKPPWARTPPSASWRFDSGRDARGPPPGRRERSPRRGRSITPPRRRDYSPRKDDRRERDYDRRDRDRSRSPDDRDREMKDVRDRRDDEDDRENGANGDDRKGVSSLSKLWKLYANASPSVSMDSPIPAHDDLDTAE